MPIRNIRISTVSYPIDHRNRIGYDWYDQDYQSTIFLVDNQRLSLKELYSFAKSHQGKHGILCSIRTMIANEIKVKIVFVQNRNKKSEWLAILRTDCRLSEQEILRINGIHWNIKVFFKTTKFLFAYKESSKLCCMICLSNILPLYFLDIMLYRGRISAIQISTHWKDSFMELCDKIVLFE